MSSVLFIPTQATHVAAFAPVVRDPELRACIHRVDILTSLNNLRPVDIGDPDAIYRWRANREGFHTRFTERLAQTNRARAWWQNMSSTAQYGLVVVGNDGGGFQKTIVLEARRMGVPTLVMQDGVLTHAVHPPATRPVRAIRSRMIRRFPLLNALISSHPGNAAEYAAVYGDSTRRVFLAASFAPANVVVTGSPRHKTLRDEVFARRFHSRPNGETVVLFLPANHRRSGQHEAARAQELSLRWLVEAAVAANQRPLLKRISVHLRPHPRESPVDYAWLSDEYPSLEIRTETRDSYSHQLADADAVLGMATTGLLDAAIAGLRVAQFRPPGFDALPDVPGVTRLTSIQDTYAYLCSFDADTVPTLHPAASELGSVIADATASWDSVKECARLIARLLGRSDQSSAGADLDNAIATKTAAVQTAKEP